MNVNMGEPTRALVDLLVIFGVVLVVGGSIVALTLYSVIQAVRGRR